MKQVEIKAPTDTVLKRMKEIGVKLSQAHPDMVQFRVEHPFPSRVSNMHRLVVSVCNGYSYVSGSVDAAVDDFAASFAVVPEPGPAPEPAPEPAPKKAAPKKKTATKKSSKPKPKTKPAVAKASGSK